MSKHILLLTIGPVQDFIAQARKTRDLAAGSRILSTLIGEARKFLEQSEATDIIFPSKEIETPPNRILALVDDAMLKKVEDAQGLEHKLRNQFMELATSSLGTSLSATAKRQIEACLKVYWVALPYEESNYRSTYKKLDCLLGGHKQLRQIQGLGEQGRKCDVDGSLNVQYYRKLEKETDKSAVNKKLFSADNMILGNDSSPFRMKDLAMGEGLSAISMVKRKFDLGADGDFHSTAEFALMETLNQLRSTGGDELKMAINCLGNANSQFFYEENLMPNTFLKLKAYGAKIGRTTAVNYQRQVARKAKEQQPRLKLAKYYAILLFDVDNMGKILSGDAHWVKEDVDLLTFQKELSTQMALFAKEVKKKVNGKNSRTVYAGGDDFLGFINLNDLLPLMREIRKVFKRLIHEKLKHNLVENKQITFSAGAAIAHYKMPLSIVLNNARSAEKLAKDNKGKNAFGITALKKSGEMEQTIWPWQIDESEKSTIQIIEANIQMLQSQQTSNAYLSAFNRLFTPMVNDDGNLGKADDGKKMGEIVASELKRLFERASMQGQEEKLAAEMADQLSLLYRNDIQTPLANFTALLNITDFISRQTNQKQEG